MDASFPAAEGDFGLLLADAKRRNAQFDEQGIPKIHRRVDQIEEDSRRLVAKAARTGDLTNKNRGHYLLARRGYDADKLARSLNAIDLRTPFEPLDALADTDVVGYLQHQHELVVVTAVMEAKKETVASFERAYVASLEAEWDEKKRELLDAFRGAQASANPSLPLGDSLATPGKVSTGAGGALGGTSGVLMDAKMKAYADVVQAINEEGANPGFGMVEAFHETAAGLDDRDARKNEVVDSWALLGSIIDEQGQGFNAGIYPPPPNMFQERYEAGDPSLKWDFVKGAKTFLEAQYHALIIAYLENHKNELFLSGRPSFVNCVKSFVECKFPDNNYPQQLQEMYEGYPVWPIIYYCLRCGEVEALEQYVASIGPRMATFAGHLSDYLRNPNGILEADAWSELVSTTKKFKVDPDPYKRAVHSILSRFDLTPELSDVFSTAQDFMWASLSLLTDVGGPQGGPGGRGPEPNSLPRQTLGELQETLLSYGREGYFNQASQSPLLYFQVLLMSQQFEEALAYLLASDHYAVEAVHFAVALAHYGIMRLAGPDQFELVKYPDEPVVEGRTPSFNFVKLVGRYTRSFSKMHPRETVAYLLRLPDPVEPIANLLLETQEFRVILGELQSEGSASGSASTSGLLSREGVKDIMIRAGAGSEEKLRYQDAITLYYAAGECDKVLEILNRLLAKVVAVVSDERTEIRDLASATASRMFEEDKIGLVSDQRLIANFNLLQQLMDFFDLYYASRYEEALEAIDSLSILPVDTDTLEARVSGFRHVAEPVTRNLPEILVACMTIFYKLYCQAKEEARSVSFSRDLGLESFIESLRVRARLLTTFSGMLPYRLPAETNAKLLRMEVFIS